MLDMGFIHDIRRIIKLLPKKRQTLLFSATFSDEIRQLAKSIVYKPVEVSVSPPNSTVDKVKQSLIAVEKADKTRVLTRLILENDWFQVLVFSRTKHGANRLAKQLIAKGIEASAIHGNKSQGARTRALAEFKDNKVRVLVATDIAARGIDIDQLPYVVNFDLPQVAEDYVHRIGRTGRAGATGEAVSLVGHDEFKLLSAIERLIKKEVPRIHLDGYQPLNDLPSSKGDFRDLKPKKPKKAKPSNRPKSNSNKGGKANNSNRNNKSSKSANSSSDKKTDGASRSKPSLYGADKNNQSASKNRQKNASSKSHNAQSDSQQDDNNGRKRPNKKNAKKSYSSRPQRPGRNARRAKQAENRSKNTIG